MTLPGMRKSPAPLRFDGETHEPEHDRKRLGRQLQAVFDLMQDGAWWTLDNLERELFWRFAVTASTQSISARLRDLRKPKFGGHTVNRRRLCGGVYEYQLILTTSTNVDKLSLE